MCRGASRHRLATSLTAGTPRTLTGSSSESRRETRICVYGIGEEEPVHVLDPDDHTWALAFGRDEQIQSFELAAGELATPIDIGDRLVAMAFGPDGQTIIGGTDRGTLVRVDLGD